MFNILDTSPSHHCQGFTSRRSFLQVGTLALGGLALPDLLAARSLASSLRQDVRDKAVVSFGFSRGGISPRTSTEWTFSQMARVLALARSGIGPSSRTSPLDFSLP